MSVPKCLACRGHFNRYPGYASRLDVFWRLVTIKGEILQHSVRFMSRLGMVLGGGVLWRAKTACGIEFDEEVYDD